MKDYAKPAVGPAAQCNDGSCFVTVSVGFLLARKLAFLFLILSFLLLPA